MLDNVVSRTRLICRVLVGLAASVAMAQTPTGTIQGLIVDASGAVVPGVRVTVTNTRTNERNRSTTNSQGRYVALYLLPGSYTVEVAKDGFRPVRSAEVILNVGQSRSIDLTLEVGGVVQSVVVEAAPPPVDMNTSSMGQIVDNKRIMDLPLNGRSVFSLASLVPGVNPEGDGATPQIGGGRAATSDILIDGVTTEWPSGNPGMSGGGYQPQVDAVEEFSVQVNALSAEYGRFGGGIINVAMKSGTNKIHGSAYEFLRNSKLDANNFFANKAGISKGNTKQNQFGGTVGGPVYLPRLYNGRDKTFFFFGYEGKQARTQSVYTQTVPPEAWRNGDFSNLRNASGAFVTLYDPYSAMDSAAGSATFVREAFPDNRIPASRISPVAAGMMKYFPQPNATPVNQYLYTNNFIVSGAPVADSYRTDARVDHNLAPWWRMFLRISHDWAKNTPLMYYGNVASPGGRTDPKNTQGGFDHTITLSPTVVANIRYGLVRFTRSARPFSEGMDLTTLGFPSYLNQMAAIQGSEIPTTTFNGTLATLGSGGYSHYTATNSLVQNLTGSVTKISGKHNLKIGGEYRKLFVNQVGNLGYPAGQFAMNATWTQKSLSTNNTQGFPLASFMLGLPASGSINHGTDPADSSSYTAVYLQDDWRITPRLTLNLGLRYDIDRPRTERFNHLNYFDMYEKSPIAGMVSPDACPSCGNLRGAMHFVGAGNRSQTPTDWNDLGPRIGLAFRVFRKTMIRAGYGIAYAPSAVQAAAVGGDGSDAFRSSTSYVASVDDMRTVYATMSDPFPQGFNTPAGSTRGTSTWLGLSISESLFDNWKVPYIQQWNTNIQQALPGKMLAEIGYMGSRGIGLVDGDGTVSYNQLPASYMALGTELTRTVSNPFYGVITDSQSTLSLKTVAARQLMRPFPHYVNVNSTRKPGASSIYHAMTARVDKRFSSGMSFLFAYTAGKLIDDSSQAVTSLGQIYGSKLDAYNRRLERSISSVDVSQRMVISYVYDLPIGRGRHLFNHMPKAVDIFAGGWQVNGITTLQSGLPLLVFPTTNNTYIYSGQRPSSNGRSARLTGGTTDARVAKWFDTSAFSQPETFTFGNLSRTVPDTRIPGRNLTNLSVFKNFNLGPDRRFKLRYQVEMFGAFNKPQWGSPGNTLGSGSFGVISSSSGARQIQMAMKLHW